MARLSRAKTPKTPAAWRDHEDESLLTTEHVGRVADLGSVAEESDTELLRDSPVKHTRNSPAEEVGEMVLATAAEINKGHNLSVPKSTGKLRRVSNGLGLRAFASNPPYQNPTRTVKKLGPSLAARPDTYAVDISPDKDPRKQLRRDIAGAGISPRRKQKRAKGASPARERLEQSWVEDQERANQQLVDQQLQESMAPQQQDFSSPRRSKRQQEKELSTQEAHEKQWFRDPPQYEVGIPTEGDEQLQADPGAAEAIEAPREVSPRKRGSLKGDSPVRAQLCVNTGGNEQSISPQRPANVQHLEVMDDARAEPAQDQEMQDQRMQDREMQDREMEDQRMQDQRMQDQEMLDQEMQDKVDDHQPVHVNYDDAVEDQQEEIAPAEACAPRDSARKLFRGPVLAPADLGYSAIQSSPAKSASPKKQIMRQKKRRANAIDQTLQHAANTSKKVRADAEPVAESGPSTCRLLQDEAEEGLVGEAAEHDVEEGESLPPGVDTKRLYGHWQHLRDAFRFVNDIGVQYVDGVRLEQHKFKRLHDEAVKIIINICKEAFVKLREREEVASKLTEIADRVDALYRADENNKIDFENLVRIKSIYAKLVPTLLAFLKRLTLMYEATDGINITKRHLSIVVTFIKVVMDLEEGAERFVRPDSTHALIQPNRRILAALKKAHTGLGRELTRMDLQDEREEQDRRYQEEMALEDAREAEEERVRAELSKVRRAWHSLHTERLWAEAGIMSLQKQRHLRVPELEEELDQDGRPFIREQVFHPRIGPPPALVELARAKVWTMLQIDALDYGLKKFAGPHVFVKLMRESCGKGKPLHEFSVTEIVTTAAMYKDYMADRQMKEIGRVEGWVSSIPNWTRGQRFGQENVDQRA